METLKRKDINEILRIIGDSGQPVFGIIEFEKTAMKILEFLK